MTGSRQGDGSQIDKEPTRARSQEEHAGDLVAFNQDRSRVLWTRPAERCGETLGALGDTLIVGTTVPRRS